MSGSPDSQGVNCVVCGTRYHESHDLDSWCPVCKARAEVERLEKLHAGTAADYAEAERENERLRQRLNVVEGMWMRAQDAADALEVENQRLRGVVDVTEGKHYHHEDGSSSYSPGNAIAANAIAKGALPDA